MFRQVQNFIIKRPQEKSLQTENLPTEDLFTLNVFDHGICWAVGVVKFMSLPNIIPSVFSNQVFSSLNDYKVSLKGLYFSLIR